MRRWLSNSAMAMIVLACAFAWQVHRGSERGTLTGTQKGLYIAGGIVAGALGLAGMKERHRRD